MTDMLLLLPARCNWFLLSGGDANEEEQAVSEAGRPGPLARPQSEQDLPDGRRRLSAGHTEWPSNLDPACSLGGLASEDAGPRTRIAVAGGREATVKMVRRHVPNIDAQLAALIALLKNTSDDIGGQSGNDTVRLVESSGSGHQDRMPRRGRTLPSLRRRAKNT